MTEQVEWQDADHHTFPATAAALYAADCKRRGAMMQGGFGFLPPDQQRPWKFLADLINACDHMLDNKGDWVPEISDAIDRAWGRQ